MRGAQHGKHAGMWAAAVVVLNAVCAAGQAPVTTRVYKTVAGTNLALHIFRPAEQSVGSRLPGIVFFHGGGWTQGTPAQFFPQSRYLAGRGMVAISVEYRIQSRHGTTPRESLQDAKSALRWVRRNADELGLDPQRIAAAGGSAGGHLAAALACVTAFDEPGEDASVSPRPDALVLFNPVIDQSPGGWGHGEVSSYWRSFSPLHNIASNMPPTLFMVGTKDDFLPLPTAEEFRKKMAAAGARCELRLYPGAGHGFFNYRDGRNRHYYVTLLEMDTFLSALGWLRGKPSLTIPEGL